ncbi:MAG: acyltransferase domain-containing protein, partial [Armatimonadota bacterium]|nr:acyltransferase domain-containing protein [Armatimonadota bacterium]
MGRQLLEHEPVFRETIESCDRQFQIYTDWSLLQELLADQSTSRLDKTEIGQPALFAIQIGLLALWRSWGIEPAATLGHSVGEVAAAYAAGILSLEDAAKVVIQRSHVQEAAAGKGRMAAASVSFEQAQQALSAYDGRLSIAALNAPTAVTLSGDADALQDVVEALENQDIFCRYLRLNYAFHSHHMDAIEQDLLQSLEPLQPQSASIPFISTVTGDELEGAQCGPRHWWDNVRQPVLFMAAMNRLIEDGYTTFLEIGPHPTLSSYIAECLAVQGKAGTVAASLHRQKEDRVAMLGALGELYIAGYPVQWEKLYARHGALVPLPSYPWQREHHWHQPEESNQTLWDTADHPLLGWRIPSANAQWLAEVDTSILTYLNDVRVQGVMVFPAAAYLEMGLAAAQQLFGEGCPIVEDLELQKALVLSDAYATKVQTIIDAQDSGFTIYSQTDSQDDDTDSDWDLHVKGQLGRTTRPQRLRTLPLDEVRRRCPQVLSRSAHYQEEERRGHQYRLSFQGVHQIWCSTTEALAEIQTPEALEPEIQEYNLHPAVLGACFQSCRSLLPRGVDADRSSYVPVRIERFRLYARPSLHLYCHVRLLKRGASYLSVDCSIANEAAEVIAEMQGLRWQAIDLSNGEKPIGADDLLYEYKWQLKPIPSANGTPTNGTATQARQADYLPDPHDLARLMQPRVEQWAHELNRDHYYQQLEPQLDALCSTYVANAFHKLGWSISPGERVSLTSLCERLGILPQHHQLTNRFLQMLEADGILRCSGTEWEVCRSPQSPQRRDPDEVWRHLALQNPSYHAEFSLIGRSGRLVAEVLSGVADPLQIIFDDKAGAVEHLYEVSPSLWLYNKTMEAVATEIVTQLPRGRTLRILEIGAGLGGTTIHLLPRLPADRVEYVFTDVSPTFLAKAEQKFRNYPFVKYQLLDIEQDPLQQGFEAHSFDLILAANVLHATRSLAQTLANVQTLLSSQGLLSLIEMSRSPQWMDLIFGSLPGWWRFEDRDLRAQLFLPGRQWVAVLQNCGFEEAVCVSDEPLAVEPIASVVLARGPERQASIQLPRLPAPQPGQQWVLFADGSGLAQAVHEQLTAHGQSTYLIDRGPSYERISNDRFMLNPGRLEDMQKLAEALFLDGGNGDIGGIIHCWSLDAVRPEDATSASLEAVQEFGCLSVIHLVQALATVNRGPKPRLWLLTSGAQSLHPGMDQVAVAQSPLWELGRTIMHGQPELRCTLVDLSGPAPDDAVPSYSSLEIQNLLAEFFSDDAEDELLLRGDARYVNRLRRTSLRTMAQAQRSPESKETESFRLEIAAPGNLDTLALTSATRCA